VDERALRFGIALPNAARFGDPREAAHLASTAEDTGWDGFFIWDVLGFMFDDPRPTFDPWVILAAVAMATERIRLGTCVAVLPRYQPHLLAMTLASLDVLSEGRLTLGVGLGAFEREFSAFDQPTDRRARAERLDEGLEVMTRLWSGEEVTHRGKHYTAEKVTMAPLPVQRPRIPIWIGGDSSPALRRAARWDGWIGPTDPWKDIWTPEDLVSFREKIEAEDGSTEPVEIAWCGMSTPEDQDMVEAYRQAGASWWIEMVDWNRGSYDEMLERVAEGPPR
jgi:probable F420-dependent oxidoreductase